MLKKHNPAFLAKEELIRSFVVRHTELELIVRIIRENVTASNQHVMVIGPRGIGKTMLVLRAAEEVRRNKELSEKWYPLVFSEESYPVTSPGEFWLEALFHLGHQTGDKKWTNTYEELHSEQDEERLRNRALAQLMDFADAAGKRILLIVENFNMLVGEQISDNDAWALRQTLLNEPRVMLLATATSRFEGIENSDKAMFELFKLQELEPLNEAECGELWASITGKGTSDRRIRPVQIFTGGNPRLVAIISTFAARMSLKELMGDLMQLVDDNTDYFKSHLDSLPPIERKAYLALAELWDPATAREVARAARLDVSKTSALLRRLVERGRVAEANGRGRRKLYQVAERMYNIYYLMRRRGGASGRVKAVVRFMVIFYGQKELVSMTHLIAEEACKLESKYREDHYYAYEAILESVSGGMRYKLLEATPKNFFEMPDVPDSIKEFAKSEKDKELTKLLKQGEDLEKAGKAEEAESLYRRAIELAPKDARPWGYLGQLLHEHLDRYEEAEEAYRKAVELDVEYAWGWGQLGQLLHEHLGCYEEAEEAYRRAIELEPKVAWGWGHLGQLLHKHLGRYEDAEESYRKAVELDAEYTWAWAHLGQLLHKHLSRYEDAEESYRKAVELDAEYAWAWGHLGQLLHEHLGRYEDAEEAYRRVIELAPKTPFGWGKLGELLHKHLERYEEAEESYRKALELQPGSAFGWAKLGQLLEEHLECYEEAEEAYRKAIELKPEMPLVWAKLGVLLHRHLDRYEEAEAAYRKAIDLDAECIGAWALLGTVLQFDLERYEEAEQAYRKVIELEPEVYQGWLLVGHLLHLNSERYEEAEQAYRKAIELDGQNALAWKGLILLLQEKMGRSEEALGLLREYVEKAEMVKGDIDSAIDLFVDLAAGGYGGEALEILRDSASAEILEPLVVGLRMFVGEDVKAAAEIMEVGKDVVKRIKKRRKS